MEALVLQVTVTDFRDLSSRSAATPRQHSVFYPGRFRVLKVQTCEPGPHRKPCKPCFLVGRWRTCALAPPVLEYRQEGSLLPGACVRARAITIGGNHHHRHHHHKDRPSVTVVMVVTVAAYCLHQRARKICPGDPTVTRRRAPASKLGCPAVRAAHARRRYGPDARHRTQGAGSASAANRAGPAS